MEIKTNIELLNEISAKLGGKSDASVLVEGLNNIANALGDTDPDQVVTVSQALETVLDHMDGGGGGGIELASVTCHITLSEDLQQGGYTGAGLYLQGFWVFDGQLVYGNGFQCGTGTDVTILVPKNIPQSANFIVQIDPGSIGVVSGSSVVPVPSPYIEIVDSDCIDEENNAVIKDGTVTIEVGADLE